MCHRISRRLNKKKPCKVVLGAAGGCRLPLVIKRLLVSLLLVSFTTRHSSSPQNPCSPCLSFLDWEKARETEREIPVLQINGCAGLPTKVDPEGTGALRCGPSASFSTGARAVCGSQSILSVEERGAPCPFEGF